VPEERLFGHSSRKIGLMLTIHRLPAFSIRVALTIACLAGAAAFWPSAQTASAQTVRRCTNTGCDGVTRCYFYGSVNCSMTNVSCTNTAC
jgi:hypothetical protein